MPNPVYYTTGEVAKLLGFSPRTINKLVDSNQLCGFRLPGSLHRRVRQQELVKFIQEHKLPIPPKLEKLFNSAPL